MHYKLPKCLVNREQYILKHCRGKRVLHVGCIDWSSEGYWQEAISNPRWLHKSIEQIAQEVVGIDTATEAITYLREIKGLQNIYLGDAQYLEKLRLGIFDVVVAGEVLEHLPNPGLFLESAHTVIASSGILILSTTNAYCARRFLRILVGQESIHPDHVSYYSHRTLARLAELCGYSMIEQCSYRIPNKRPLWPFLLERFSCLLSPNFGEGIIFALRPKLEKGQ
jgi:2-polyprenyl-3-methyl-5-hydroxy-6-metoxy-1,4-benzoquinol methylase